SGAFDERRAGGCGVCCRVAAWRHRRDGGYLWRNGSLRSALFAPKTPPIPPMPPTVGSYSSRRRLTLPRVLWPTCDKAHSTNNHDLEKSLFLQWWATTTQGLCLREGLGRK